MTTRTIHYLTERELADVIAEVKDNGEVAGIVLLWEYVLGESLDSHDGQVAVMDHLIPADQWKEILQAIFDTGSAGLDWMNSSPSSYDFMAEHVEIINVTEGWK